MCSERERGAHTSPPHSQATMHPVAAISIAIAVAACVYPAPAALALVVGAAWRWEHCRTAVVCCAGIGVILCGATVSIAPARTAALSKPVWSGEADFLLAGTPYVRALRTTKMLADVYSKEYNFTAYDASTTAWMCDIGLVEVTYEVRDRHELVGSPGCTSPEYFACDKTTGIRCKCVDAEKWHEACAKRVWSDYIRSKTSEEVFKMEPLEARAALLNASSEQCRAYGTVATVWTTPKLGAPFSGVDEKLQLISTRHVFEQADAVTADAEKRSQKRALDAAAAVAETQRVAAHGDAEATIIAASAQANVTLTIAAADARAKQMRLTAEFVAMSDFIEAVGGSNVAGAALTAWAVHAKPGAAYLGNAGMAPHISAAPTA